MPKMPARAPLEALLRAYAPPDAEESRHRERMLALLHAPNDPFSRAHFAPGHFTASGFVMSPDAARLLLIHHRKLGRWLQPGGHIEAADADVIAAAHRELREEVGLSKLVLEIEGVFDLDVHTIPPLGAEPAHEHFDLRFLFRASVFEFQAGSEIRAARWVPFYEIDETQSDHSVVRAMRKLILQGQFHAPPS